MPRPPHRLTNVDEDRRIADCDVCGPGTTIAFYRERPEFPTVFGWYCYGRNYQYKKKKYRVLDELTGERRWFTVADYDRMLAEQGGKCAICGRAWDGDEQHFAVDHSKTTGLVRGILCRGCNLAIGRLGDDLNGVMRAVRYLANHEPQGDKA